MERAFLFMSQYNEPCSRPVNKALQVSLYTHKHTQIQLCFSGKGCPSICVEKWIAKKKFTQSQSKSRQNSWCDGGRYFWINSTPSCPECVWSQSVNHQHATIPTTRAWRHTGMFAWHELKYFSNLGHLDLAHLLKYNTQNTHNNIFFSFFKPDGRAAVSF